MILDLRTLAFEITESATDKELITELASELLSFFRVETLLTLFGPVVDNADEILCNSFVDFLLGSTGFFGKGMPSMRSG